MDALKLEVHRLEKALEAAGDVRKLRTKIDDLEVSFPQHRAPERRSVGTGRDEKRLRRHGSLLRLSERWK